MTLGNSSFGFLTSLTPLYELSLTTLHESSSESRIRRGRFLSHNDGVIASAIGMFSVDGLSSGVDTLMTDGVSGSVEGELVTDSERTSDFAYKNETTIFNSCSLTSVTDDPSLNKG